MTSSDLGPAACGPAVLPGSIQFDLASRITGRTYRIYVSKPDLEPPTAGYPVFVAVDGNMVFPIAATVNATFAMAGKAAVVIGVGYPTDSVPELMRLRTRDLTPPTPLEQIPQRAGQSAPKLDDAGGAEGFLRFLVEELLPHVAQTYPLDDADKTLYGHSVGGLFTLGVMFRRPGVFRHFVASSPSIWWNQRAILDDFELLKGEVEAGYAAPRILLMVGRSEQSVPRRIPAVMLQQVAEKAPRLPAWLRGVAARFFVGRLARTYAMVSNVRALAARLARLRGRAGYQVRLHVFPGEDHITALPASIGRALEFVLRE